MTEEKLTIICVTTLGALALCALTYGCELDRKRQEACVMAIPAGANFTEGVRVCSNPVRVQ